MAKPTQNIVGIDIGSSKVGVLIGAPDGAGGLEVVGMGSAPNRGTRRGNIVNMEATVEALKQATDEAEVMAGVEVSRAYVGMAGVDIKSVNSRGMVSVSRKDREITAADIKRADLKRYDMVDRRKATLHFAAIGCRIRHWSAYRLCDFTFGPANGVLYSPVQGTTAKCSFEHGAGFLPHRRPLSLRRPLRYPSPLHRAWREDNA